MSQTYTTAEIAKHKDDTNGYWLIVENEVYDVSSECFPFPLGLLRDAHQYMHRRG